MSIILTIVKCVRIKHNYLIIIALNKKNLSYFSEFYILTNRHGMNQRGNE